MLVILFFMKVIFNLFLSTVALSNYFRMIFKIDWDIFRSHNRHFCLKIGYPIVTFLFLDEELNEDIIDENHEENEDLRSEGGKKGNHPKRKKCINDDGHHKNCHKIPKSPKSKKSKNKNIATTASTPTASTSTSTTTSTSTSISTTLKTKKPRRKHHKKNKKPEVTSLPPMMSSVKPDVNDLDLSINYITSKYHDSVRL